MTISKDQQHNDEFAQTPYPIYPIQQDLGPYAASDASYNTTNASNGPDYSHSAIPPQYHPQQQPQVTYEVYQPPSTVVVSHQAVKERDDNEALVLALFIAGFFFHFCWLVAWMVSRRNRGSSRVLGKISCGLFSIGCCMLTVVIIVCAVAIPVSVGVGHSTQNYY